MPAHCRMLKRQWIQPMSIPMSVFVNRPAIRSAFKQYSACVSLPSDAWAWHKRAPSLGCSPWVVSAAWGYMLVFRTGREFMLARPTGVEIFDTGWSAENAVEIMAASDRLQAYYQRWSFLILRAREFYRDYLAGSEIDPERVANCCQFLASADILVRKNDIIPITAPDPEVTEELLAIDRAFDPVSLFPLRRRCVLGPNFIAAGAVGSARGGLIVDDLLVNVSMAKKAYLDTRDLRRLTIYVALHAMSDIYQSDHPIQNEPIQRIGVYFARFGRLVTWSLKEIFKFGAFEQFTDTLKREIGNEK